MRDDYSSYDLPPIRHWCGHWPHYARLACGRNVCHVIWLRNLQAAFENSCRLITLIWSPLLPFVYWIVSIQSIIITFHHLDTILLPFVYWKRYLWSGLAPLCDGYNGMRHCQWTMLDVRRCHHICPCFIIAATPGTFLLFLSSVVANISKVFYALWVMDAVLVDRLGFSSKG